MNSLISSPAITRVETGCFLPFSLILFSISALFSRPGLRAGYCCIRSWSSRVGARHFTLSIFKTIPPSFVVLLPAYCIRWSGELSSTPERLECLFQGVGAGQVLQMGPVPGEQPPVALLGETVVQQ